MTTKPRFNPTVPEESDRRYSRRSFIGTTFAAAAAAPLLCAARDLTEDETPTPQTAAAPAKPERKIKLGVIGCGGRGSWIAKLFQQHGGFEMFAVADYFQPVADKCGDALGVDKSRRFSTLSGYKRLLECGIEAVALETPPYFFHEHAHAAVEIGLHVYMAKPVAVDVPGALAIEAAARRATQKQRCFLIDYQMPTDPTNLEVLKLIQDPSFGKLAQVFSVGICGGWSDPAFTANLESRMEHLIWTNDVAMGCDFIGNYDIHAIDAALWAIGERPVAALGTSSIRRSDPHGDSHDVCSVIYEYANGVVHNHYGQALSNQAKGELSCHLHSPKGNAFLTYWGKATMRSSEADFNGEVENLYEAGAVRNIARFHQDVTGNQFANDTVRRSVDGVLACILGREAAARHSKLTMEALIQENKRLTVELRGLKA